MGEGGCCGGLEAGLEAEQPEARGFGGGAPSDRQFLQFFNKK